MRIGHGYDVHAFGPGDQVTLGGVRIAHTHGLVAHSDGDVLLHAVCDALLGAAALGDIGRHFPDDDPALKGIDSRILLRRVAGELVARGLRLGNLDATVIAQSPRLAPHINEMVANLASDLEAGAEQVNIKATTTERLGWLGRSEGIAAHAVVVVLPWTTTWS